MVDRDCNTCRHHIQGGGIEGTKELCWHCRSSQIPYLPHWEPVDSMYVTPELKEELKETTGLPATKTQVGGNHYTRLKIQPMHYSLANNLNAAEHTAIKYITRRKGDKNKRLEDLDKAIHVLHFLKEEIQAGTCD